MDAPLPGRALDTISAACRYGGNRPALRKARSKIETPPPEKTVAGRRFLPFAADPLVKWLIRQKK